ncbi:MAG TPA: hypothetical protein VNM92_18125 [Thermoanaerobaculia bacterium]|nr:hypothetical protein [Thermoanaerobaculia bacterium]
MTTFARKYKHNDLFRPSNNTRLNACVGTNGGPYDFKAYAWGYFEAGKRLAVSIEEDSYPVDVLIYPLVFTFRHAIELGLKHLAQKMPAIWRERKAMKLTHNLADNWKLVRTYLERDSDFDRGEKLMLIEFVGLVLTDFLELDPRGEAFRYPEARDGSAFLQDTSIINAKVFAGAMSDVADAFEYWFDLIDDIYDNLAGAQEFYHGE